MTVNESKRIRVYRFHDYVALTIGDSETLYLKRPMANALCYAVKDVCEDIDTQPLFAYSNLTTVEHTIERESK